MQSASQLWLFFLMVFGIIALPGMDMAFVLSNTVAGGRLRGAMAVAGIVAGGMCHVLAAYLGLALLVATVPGLMQILLLAGSAYLCWIGWGLWHSEAAPMVLPKAAWHDARQVFWQAVLTSLLNPKAYFFMLAVFPQFLQHDKQSLVLQSLVLGVIIALTQTAIYGVVVWGAARSRRLLMEQPSAWRNANRVVGGMLILAAVATAMSGLTSD